MINITSYLSFYEAIWLYDKVVTYNSKERNFDIGRILESMCPYLNENGWF